MKEPPSVRHLGPRPEKRVELIDELVDKLRLSGREAALLRYYTCVSGRFKPAIRTIADNTGIDRNKIWEVRTQLHNKGLLYYDPEDRVIYIDWPRLRALASVPPSRVRKAICLEPMPREKIERMKILRRLGHRWLHDVRRWYVQYRLFEQWPDFMEYAFVAAGSELQYRREQQYGCMCLEKALEEQSDMMVLEKGAFDFSVMFPDGYDNIPF